MPTPRPFVELLRDVVREPTTGAYRVLFLVGQSVNLAGLVTRRPQVQFAGISTTLVALVIAMMSFARSIKDGWPYRDGISPADRLRAANEADGITPEPLTDVYRRWIVAFGQGLIGRRRFARRNRIPTWITVFALIVLWASWESFGDFSVGGVSGFLTKLVAGTAVLVLVIAWIETADRLCARRARLESLVAP